MNQTQNLHLPQWEADDRIMRTDFNNAMSKLDTAMAANAAAMPRIVTGTYVGDGAETRTISLGFTPKAAMLFDQSGNTTLFLGGAYYRYGGLALRDHPCAGQSGNTVFSIVTNGMKVCYTPTLINNVEQIIANNSGTTYFYIAIG